MTAVQISLHFRRVSSTKKAETEVPLHFPNDFRLPFKPILWISEIVQSSK